MIEVAGSERLRDRRVLVTGGAGFIGSNLVSALLGIGARVRVLDNLSTGTLDNLAEHQGDGRLLGYRPRASIREGLDPTVRWLADRQERP